MDEIWELERNCWLKGRSFYEEIITSESAYAFPPPMGIFKGADFVSQMGEDGPCVSVEFENQIAQDFDKLVVLIYKGIGTSPDGSRRISHCSTV